jgi:hypothetical protein
MPHGFFVRVYRSQASNAVLRYRREEKKRTESVTCPNFQYSFGPDVAAQLKQPSSFGRRNHHIWINLMPLSIRSNLGFVPVQRQQCPSKRLIYGLQRLLGANTPGIAMEQPPYKPLGLIS